MKRKNILGVLFILIGILLFISKLGDYSISALVRQYWPIVFIILGIVTLFSGKGRGIKLGERGPNTEDHIDYMTMFGGVENKNTSKGFRGGAITAVFGGAEIDLSGASISESGCNLSVTAIFGGIDIKLPDKCELSVNGIPVFGGFENKKQVFEEGPKINLNYFVLFGAIEIS